MPIYYRGYKEVLLNLKKPEDIMGYGEIQLFLLNLIGDYLKSKIGKKFWVLVGEGGLHMGHKKNLSIDLFIYEKEKLSYKKMKNKYLSIPPKVLIEVDTKADPEIFQTFNYYNKKTEKLLDYGVEQVVWVFTDPEKVMTATKNNPWITVSWSKTIEILGASFTINQIIEDSEK